MDKLRIDKWLWAARFYKTRSLAVEEIDKGRVRLNDVEAKPSRERWWCAASAASAARRRWRSSFMKKPRKAWR